MQDEPPHVAVVDDDISFREAVVGLVASFGFCVASFSSAEDFLKSGLASAVEWLIVDVQMAEMSGLDLQDQLVSEGIYVPTIVVTAAPDAELRDRALQAGAIAFLAKPFDWRDLLDHLRHRPHGVSLPNRRQAPKQ